MVGGMVEEGMVEGGYGGGGALTCPTPYKRL